MDKPKSISAIAGHGRCIDGKLCAYHEGKVNNSVCPSPEVYGEKPLEEIHKLLNSQKVEELSLEELIKNSLKLIDDYWKEHANELVGNLISAHRSEYKEAQKKDMYLAGGWMASPQQFSQLHAVMWVLNKKGKLTSNSDVLRLGTASGAHSEQLAGIFSIINSDLDPELTIIDKCNAPLENSKHLTEKLKLGDVVTDMRNLIKDASMDVVTGHFITSFIPGKDSPEASGHAKSLAAKLQLFSNANYVLKLGGCLCICIGTSPKDPRRFNNQEEISNTIKDAGFRDINIVETTDPLDFTDGSYDPGNFFVVAFK
ncbi:hypothetical protein GF369_03250 [Candidatus Peregrinibacteria bacterium]|nr:hypothetical protein [Candidatus Peregrinibacteria bacterium]